MTGRVLRLAPRIPVLVLAVFAIVWFAAVLRVTNMLALHVPLDPNEGWNAYLARMAMTGLPLYPRADSYFVNNYPPLSFYAVGALGGFIHDMVAAGRLIALVAYGAVAICLRAVLQRFGASFASALTGAIFFVTWLIVTTDYVGMDDPQMLGHALEMGALLLSLRGRSEWAAAGLFVVALFVKHNLVALPLAVAAWLLCYERARARRFMLAGIASGLLGLLLFRIAYGTSLISHLASARSYSFALLGTSLATWLAWGLVPLAITATAALRYRRDRAIAFAALYAAIALGVGIAFAGGAGVDTNVFFDADIALSLGVGLAIARLMRDGAVLQAAAISLTLLVPLVAGLWVNGDPEARNIAYWLHPMADDARLAQADIAFLRARRGDAVCESLALCYWAGKPPTVDVFNVGEEFRTGARSDADLVRRLVRHSYAAMEFDSLDSFALTPRVKAALLSAYRIDHTDDLGTFLVPR